MKRQETLSRIIMSEAPLSNSTIIIVGSGCFGLSAALELATRPSFSHATILLIDATDFPNKDASSQDVNRIARSDYPNPLYASLASEALQLWRHSDWGAQKRYTESGLLMLADNKTKYLANALELARERARDENNSDGIVEVQSKAEIELACRTGGSSGCWGYLNQRAGWVDAEHAMRYTYEKAKELGRITMLTYKVTSLLRAEPEEQGQKPRVRGVVVEGGIKIQADLTVIATGAWTPMLLDMRGRAAASAEVLAYMTLSDEEALGLRDMPAIINLTKGWFIIPPNGNILKVARHGKGFPNLTSCSHPQLAGEEILVSTPCLVSPKLERDITTQGLHSCRQALSELIPSLASRPLSQTRLCWYTDTPTADFIIDFHPEMDGLFVATGGSGHAFKFLPILGEKIVDAIEDVLNEKLKILWAWKTGVCVGCEVEGDEMLHENAYQARGGVLET